MGVEYKRPRAILVERSRVRGVHGPIDMDCTITHCSSIVQKAAPSPNIMAVLLEIKYFYFLLPRCKMTEELGQTESQNPMERQMRLRKVSVQCRYIPIKWYRTEFTHCLL